MNLIKVLFLSFCVAFIVTACKVSYSFTGGTLSPEVKTFSVQFFPNRAPLVNPNLSNQFTEALKEKFRGQTTLDEIVDGEGHLNFEGEITGYRTQALDVTADDISATNRLTVTVKVRFTNEIEPDNDFDKSFSAFRDFDSTKQLSDVEEELVVQILEDIIDDIYNEAVVNW
ncbi:LptE family protein [Labilibaculum sp.]|uniref:LptE family protein n=1 Tax=Labilibaculum sp. TaxID=2060723 RepID=UPI002AA84573|nr:LptE family protein [Labilibaculum sp.]MBN2596494.1 LptE family protein [Marinifilaceae bacterium]